MHTPKTIIVPITWICKSFHQGREHGIGGDRVNKSETSTILSNLSFLDIFFRYLMFDRDGSIETRDDGSGNTEQLSIQYMCVCAYMCRTKMKAEQ